MTATLLFEFIHIEYLLPVTFYFIPISKFTNFLAKIACLIM